MQTGTFFEETLDSIQFTGLGSDTAALFDELIEDINNI